MRFIVAAITVFCFLSNINTALAQQLLLESGTKIKLKLDDKISSSINKEGDLVNFIIANDVLDGDSTLIKAGSRATGVITEIMHKKGFGQEGYIKVEFDYALAVDGQKVPITGYFDEYGDADYMPVISILLLPFAPFFRGDDAGFNVGYLVYARVENDINIKSNSL